uniref:Ribonuclease H n=1 Tax=Tanacetum cinerariifolium TaxID=118510 RepID=A0A6L2MTP4_TANCI|nr:ribonuclease H [Tanacetum cinerariifolium]
MGLWTALQCLQQKPSVSLSACCAQVLWMRTQLTDYGFHFDKIPMYCDSKAAIAISCNPVQYSRTKHIDVRYHFIKEKVKKGIVELFFVRTEYQLAELFTKALPEETFKYLVRRLGIELLSEVALPEDAQYEEVRKKSLKDFHKTHLSDSCTITKIAPSATKIKPSVTNESTGVKLGVPDVTKEESFEKNDSHDGITQSDNEKGSDFEHETDENVSGSESDQEKNEEEDETYEEEKEDEYARTPSYYSPTNDEDKTNVDDNAKGDKDEEMDYTTSQLYDNVDIRLNEPVDTDEGFIQKEGTNAEMTNVQQGNENLEISQVIEDAYILIDKIDKSESYLVAPEHRDCYDGLIKSYDHDKSLFSTYDKVYSLKRSQKDKDKDEDPSTGSDRGLKKRKTSNDAEPTKEEPEFEVADSDMPQDQEENPGNDDEEPKGKGQHSDFSKSHVPIMLSWNMTEECYKALLEKPDWENPEGDDYPFDLTKPPPLVKIRNRQKVPVDYFFNKCLKYLQGGISTMTYMTSLTKTKATQYDLPGIENIA